MMRFPRIPFFRIWYSTTYTIIFAILIVLLCVTPADTIYQSWTSHRIPNMFIIGSTYVLTAALVLLIYSTRLYTNRSVLAAIPKSYLPIQDGEVGKSVRRMIVRALERSAIIAWDARPRDLRDEIPEEATRLSTLAHHHAKLQRKRRPSEVVDATVIPISADKPPWGQIAHPGWSSPASEDLPNLQFWQVVLELPNLIEAKAVSLAPSDPAFNNFQLDTPDAPAIPDAHVVAILQRPATMGLRAYLNHLASLGLINPPTLGPRFLSRYEHARFSATAITEPAFRDIMAIFADILAGMRELNRESLGEVGTGLDGSFFAPTPSSSASVSGGSVRHHHIPPQADTTSSSSASVSGGSVRRYTFSQTKATSLSSSSQESLATVMHSSHSRHRL